MTDNLIPFPVQSAKADEQEGKKPDELVKLRDAFDRARQDWPLEIGELPEKNKILSGK